MIEISVVDGVPHLWHAEDVCKVREDYRIVGTAVGCLSRFPRQNNQLGLPLQLQREEAALLRDKGWAVIVDGNSPLVLPAQEDTQKFDKFREASFKEQTFLSKLDKKKDLLKNLEKIREGKKAKRTKHLEEKQHNGEQIDDEEFNKEFELDVDSIEIPPIDRQHMMVQLFTRDPFSGEDCRKEMQWTYPSTETERLRYRVFTDLWEKGHFLTAGGKFGGDFLVYPGDPSCFHSFYIAVCLPFMRKMSALDITAMGRLGSNVKKTVLLCSVNHENQLTYTSLEWTGIT